MSNIPPKKPVNDLIKFWAEKQEKGKEKKSEQILRSPRKPVPLYNSSQPSSRNDDSYQKLEIEDKSFDSPHTKRSNNVNLLISEGNNNSKNKNNNNNNSNSIINIRTISKNNEQGRIDWTNSLSQNDSTNVKTSSSPPSILALKTIPPVPAKDTYITRPRNHNHNMKEPYNKNGSLPPVRRVTDLVTKFENVTSPTSPRLNENQNHFIISEPLSLPSPTFSNVSTKQVTNKAISMSSSSTSPIQYTIPNQNHVTQTRPISSNNLNTSSFNSISSLRNSKNVNTPVSPFQKPISEITMKNNLISQTDRRITSKTISNSNNDSNPFTSSSQHEIPTRPESVSSIRLPFLNFLKSSNRSSTNSQSDLDNSFDKYKVMVGPKSGDKKRQSLPTAKDTNAFIMEMHEVTNTQQSCSIPNKEDSTSTRATFLKPINGTIQLVDNLKRYLQPNKYKNADDITEPIRNNNTFQNINNNNEEKYTMTISLNKSGGFQTYKSKGGTKSRERQKFKPVQIPKFPYNTTRPERYSLSPLNTLKKNPFLVKKSKKSKNTKHDLPEYNTSKSKMSMLVPHSLASVEYGKTNRSLPDLSVRYRHHKFNDAFLKNNRTVPDFTRIDSIFEDEQKKPDFDMAIMTDATLDPSKITKFIIDPFDESESNELFKPGAPWIHLPHLDEFIRSLPPTVFSEPKELMTNIEYEKFIGYRKSEDKNLEYMFPPMNQIPEGFRLEDLKNNVLKKEGFLNQGQKNNLVELTFDTILAGQSSMFGLKMTKLELIRDFIQILALALSFVATDTLGNWVKTILVTIPNLLSFNLNHVFGYGTSFFLAFCAIAIGGLYWFRMMTKYDPNADIEGLESYPWNIRPESKRKQNLVILFILTTLYLPLSKLSLDALVWSDSFWPSNPYQNNTNFGKNNSDTIRDPQDFCYVTSMNKNDLNFSPVIIIIALITIVIYSFWFPFALKRLVDKNAPRVDKYNEMGETRNNPDKEYQRLLGKDTCPYNFMYNSYKEKYVAYKTHVMANKFFIVLCVSIISQNNCLFRYYPQMTMEAVLYSIQVVYMVILFVIHWKTEPFIYEYQNKSEYWVRLSYIVTTFLGLLSAINIVASDKINIITIVITILVCIILLWYTVIQTKRYKSFVKTLKKKLEFSLNIYSPKLDFNKQIKRRLWQETWTTLLLTSEQFRMKNDNPIAFSQSPYRPPYLLNFNGTIAERHIENLKIMRQIGIKNYNLAMSPLPENLIKLRSIIINNFVGPDMYYSPEYFEIKIKTFFGKAYVVPFPFSVIIVYDEDESVYVLTKEWEIERYVKQNENKEIQRRRLVRQMLRALEGKIIIGPNEKNNNINNDYNRGILSIQRNQRSKWNNYYNMNPGFKVTISYVDIQSPNENFVIKHDVLGITNDFQMTNQLRKLFSDNKESIQKGLKEIQKIMEEYRQYYKNEAKWKENVLTYGFFINIYDNPSIPLESLPALLVTTEENQLIQSIPESEYPSIIYLYERMRIVNLSRVHQWWYLFWEDLWRKNNEEISEFSNHPKDFSPAYRTSLCYRPMTRIDLEEFLEKTGCWKDSGKKGFLHSGVLNRIYLYLNNVVFGSKSKKDDKIKKWNVSKGYTIGKDSVYNNNMTSGHIKRTMKERVMVMKDIMLKRKNYQKTRPFFVLHEEINSDSENIEHSEDSDGINSASDEEIWL